MSRQKLDNYLRTCRKRSGLTQGDIAYLLGTEDGTQLSRYERRRHAPALRTALALEALFGAPVSEMFAGVYESVEKDLKRRARKLAADLRTENGKNRAQKLQWLVDRSITPPADLPLQ